MTGRVGVFLLICFLICDLSAFSQEDAPIPPRRTRAAKVGALGGFTPGWLFLDVAPINDILIRSGGTALGEKGVMLYGGAGSAYIMLVPNLRVGGMGMGGALKSVRLDQAGVRREAELNVGFGGVTFEYVIPIVERLDVTLGTMLGGGGVDIVLRQNVGGSKTWNGEWGQFGNGNYQLGGQITDIKRTLSGSFFIWIPSVNVEYSLLGWLGVRVGASYVGMSAPSWKLDDDHQLFGVPSNVHGKGLMVNAGLMVGTF
jgi:hypothetical protein